MAKGKEQMANVLRSGIASVGLARLRVRVLGTIVRRQLGDLFLPLAVCHWPFEILL